jgi:predicted nucleic-acid-binding protein
MIGLDTNVLARYFGTPEKGKSTAAQLVSAIERR